MDSHGKLPKKHKHKKVRFYYSFMSIILLLCLILVVRSSFLSIQKNIFLGMKVRQLNNLHEKASEKNERLKDELKSYKNMSGFEGIARNKLKMAGQDEVLVIINEPPKPAVPKKKSIFQ